MKTVTIDILDNKAIEHLRELEHLHLIRMHDRKEPVSTINWGAKYKGAMTRQPLDDLNNQLNDLRSGWE